MIKTKDTYVSKLCNFFFNFKIFARCHPSVLSHHALETAECDESYYIERGDHIWSSGCWEFFYHESYCDEMVIMTIYRFQLFFCDVSSWGWVMPLYGLWAGSTHIWERLGFFGGLKNLTPYYSCIY